MLLLAEVSKVSVRGHDSRRLVLKGYGKIGCVEDVVVEFSCYLESHVDGFSSDSAVLDCGVLVEEMSDRFLALFSVTAPLSGHDPIGTCGDYVGCNRYESALEALFELWCDVSVSGMVFDEEDCERVVAERYLVSSHQS